VEQCRSSKPRSTPPCESLPPRPDEEQREATSPEYSYATPAVLDSSQKTVDYPDLSSTPTPALRGPYPSEGRPAPSGYPESYSRQLPPLQYQSFQNESGASSGYHTTPSGWPATPRNPPRNASYINEAARPQFQSQYENPNEWTASHGMASRGLPATSQFPSQNTIRTPLVQYGGSAETGRSFDYYSPASGASVLSSRVPWQQGAQSGQNSTLGYQNQYPAQVPPSGLRYNMATAARRPYPVPNSTSAQYERSGYIPGVSPGGPQSMFPSYGLNPNSGLSQIDGPTSFENDPVDEVTGDMEYTTLTPHSSKGNSVGMLVWQRLEDVY
jgi:hypothetical protein